jgi:hypothetical protein
MTCMLKIYESSVWGDSKENVVKSRQTSSVSLISSKVSKYLNICHMPGNVTSSEDVPVIQMQTRSPPSGYISLCGIQVLKELLCKCFITKRKI